jgi:hypothetical protein
VEGDRPAGDDGGHARNRVPDPARAERLPHTP